MDFSFTLILNLFYKDDFYIQVFIKTCNFVASLSNNILLMHQYNNVDFEMLEASGINQHGSRRHCSMCESGDVLPCTPESFTPLPVEFREGGS